MFRILYRLKSTTIANVVLWW